MLRAAGVVTIHCNDWRPSEITLAYCRIHEILAIARPTVTSDQSPTHPRTSVTGDKQVPTPVAAYSSGAWTTLHGRGGLAAAA